MTLRDRALALLGTWSRPPDLPAKVALGTAIVLAMLAALDATGFLHGPGPRATVEDRDRERRRFLAVLSFVAALSSIAYIALYLRGGPRIIDATTYFLQGRVLAHGDLAWTPPPGPSASFHGRFLVRRLLAGEGEVLGGVFPPGYPLLLAFGFNIGAPMIVGPLLAGALVVATYTLARRVAEDVVPDHAEPIARSAALLSLFCAALRYHTADTMSHGASALGIIVALVSALRVRRSGGRGAALVAGLAVGYVVATRPISSVPIGAIVLWTLARTREPRRLLLLAVAGALPGVFLLLLSQRAVTGSWLLSTQRMYYALSDGPPGCFRFGFGKGTGCLHEHRDFVEARLRDGYGLVEAAGTTLRRLHAHLLDVANLEPLALLVPLPFLVRRRLAAPRAIAPLGTLVVLQMLAYVPFYFDGDYPGGGARFFADVLPVEHVLVMIGVAALVPRAFPRAALGVLALALAGFAVHGAYEHDKLRDRDGGRPMFEPDVLSRAGVTRGLVLVDTDHGFALGHDPAESPDTGILVARRRGDAHDRLLWEALGRPPTWRYELEPAVRPSTEVTPILTPFTPLDPGSIYRFEAEAEWPALAQEAGYALPEWVSPCASERQALVLTPEPRRLASATITVPVPSDGEWNVQPLVYHPGAAPPGARAAITVDGARWEVPVARAEGCLPLAGITRALRAGTATVRIEAAGAPVGLDAVELRKVR